MVRKNKGKKKKGGGRTKAAAKVNDDSSLIRIKNVWPELDENGCWTCTNCRFVNSSQFSWSNCSEPGGCSECGHSELDEKFAVLIISILVQLHNAGWVHRINLRLRSTWKLGVVQDAYYTYLDTINNDISIDNQFQQLHRLIKVRSLIYEEDSGSDEPERLALAVRMITDCQNEEYMKEIAKTTEFHTLIDCIQHYQNQKSKVLSSISSENNNEVSHITDDKKLGSNAEENTDRQPINKSPLTQTDIDMRLVNQYITPQLNGLKEVVMSWKSMDTLANEAGLLLVKNKLESDDITFNPRSVIQAQLQYVQLTDDHRLDNRFSMLREFVNVRSILKSDGIEMAAAKLEEASHKQHMSKFREAPLFQLLLRDMQVLLIEEKTKSMRDPIYKIVQQVQPEHALEITDMLMDLKDSKLLHLTSTGQSEALIDKIHEFAEHINNKTNNSSLEPNIPGMESFEPEPVEYNQSWQSDNDIPRRRVMVKCIAQLLEEDQNKPPEARLGTKLPDLVHHFEVSLYRSASSLKAYMDTTTLYTRLKQLAIDLETESDSNEKDSHDCDGQTVKPIHVDFDQSWQSDNDVHHRREMIQEVLGHLREKKVEQEWLKKLPQFAQRFEMSLYQSAPSLEAYLDRTTLNTRLQQSAQQAKDGKVKAGDPKDQRPKESIIDHTYRDFSQIEVVSPDDDGDPNKKTTRLQPNFPAKLHAIVSNPNYQHIICWQPHGRSWKIVDMHLLSTVICPKHFAHATFESFNRSVNGWGFKRLLNPGPDYKSYYHECFLRGRPDLTKLMHRIVNPGKRLPDIAGEPDFYEISRKFPLPALPLSLHGQQPPKDANGRDGHGQQDKLTLETLASFTPEVQKNMIRERLYPLVYKTQPELAGDITGKLLEMDVPILLHTLESPEALSGKIQDALYLLSPARTKLSAKELLGSHAFDHFKTSHGWKEKENKWGIKKYITDEDETFDTFKDIGNEALDPKSEWMQDLIEIDGVRDAIYTLAKKEENERAIEIMEVYGSYFDDDEEEEEVTVVAVKKRGKKKKEEVTVDDTESLEEKALSGDKKAMEELKKRIRECGQKDAEFSHRIEEGQEQQQKKKAKNRERFNLSWQSDNDMHHRREMIQNIQQRIRERKHNPSQQWLKKLPQMARRLEEELFRSAPSLEAYLDTTTLNTRLQQLTNDIRKHKAKEVISAFIWKYHQQRKARRLIGNLIWRQIQRRRKSRESAISIQKIVRGVIARGTYLKTLQPRLDAVRHFYDVWKKTIEQVPCSVPSLTGWGLVKERLDLKRVDLLDEDGNLADTDEKLNQALSVALVEEEEAEEIEDERIEDALSHLTIEEDRVNVQDQSMVDWSQFQVTSHVVKFMKKGDVKYKEMFVKKMKQLAKGERSHKLQKPLKRCESIIYESYLENKGGGFRILWTEEGDRIVVWFIAKHKSVSRLAKLIDDAKHRTARQQMPQNLVDELNAESSSPKAIAKREVLLDALGNVPLKLYDVNFNNIDDIATSSWTPQMSLTDEERKVVEAKGTVLLLGRSGTGKTICICNRIEYDRQRLGDKPKFSQLFVSRSSRLCRYVEKAVGSSSQSNFYTFDNLLHELDVSLSEEEVETNTRHFHPRQRVSFAQFKQFYNEHYAQNKIAALIVWKSIRTFIKGSIEAYQSSSKVLSKEYFVSDKLGKNRCKVPLDLRDSIYDIFVKYQAWLHEQRLWDDCDRIHSLLQKIDEAKKTSSVVCEKIKWSKVYVDEVQDYTQIEILLFFSISGVGSLFLAGDPAQSVEQGTDFRFEEVRAVGYYVAGNRQHLIPDKPKIVNINFRSHAGILNCAGGFLDLLFEYFPGSAKQLKKDYGLFKGARPGVFHQVQVDQLSSLLKTSLQGCVILTHDESASHWRDELNHPLVYGIREAKGLEFKSCIILNFFSDIPSSLQKPWRNLLKDREGSDFELKYPLVETHLKLIYTATTRCIEQLFFAETCSSIAGDAATRWLTSTKSSNDDTTLNTEAIATHNNVSDLDSMIMTNDEWCIAGIDNAELASSSDIDIEQSISYLNRAIYCLDKAQNSELAAKANTPLQSVQLRSKSITQDVYSSPDELEAIEREVAKITQSLLKEDLLSESVKLLDYINPCLSTYTKEKLEEKIITKIQAYDK